MTSMGSNIDDLNDFLTQLARNGGQILLREMSQERVKKIVGPGAVWPAEPIAQDIANEILLEIEAGSHGPAQPSAGDRQRATADAAADPAARHRSGVLGQGTLRRLDDRLDLTEAFKSALPSIVAMNGAMSRRPRRAPAPAPAPPWARRAPSTRRMAAPAARRRRAAPDAQTTLEGAPPAGRTRCRSRSRCRPCRRK